MKRTSYLNWLYINSVGLSGIVQIGDSKQIIPRSSALAVQRQLELFYAKEADTPIPFFSEPIPMPTSDTEPFFLARRNECPTISVNGVRVIGVSSSAIVHIGSTSFVDAKAHTKHIRQLVYEKGRVD